MDNSLFIYSKHYIKRLIGRPDPSWEMFAFEERINRETFRNHESVLRRAEESLKNKAAFEKPEAYLNSSDPIVRQGFELKTKVETEFKDKYADWKDIRILIHVPDQHKSPAGYSLFQNFIEALMFVGISVRALDWNEDVSRALQEFSPSVFLSSDHEIFLSRIDWNAVETYRKDHTLLIGLTAGLEEYGNTPLPERLVWAKQHKVDFYYSYRNKEYLETRKEYRPFYETGYKILPLMFGANIAVYYPVPTITRDIPYVFLASQNKTKASRYTEYLSKIVSSYPGFIDGPGWRRIKDFSFMRDRDRYVYARARVGINVHLNEQIEYANEVNERTYMLAACGIPQVCDDAKLLHKLYSPDALWIAKGGNEYLRHFEEILQNPQEAERRTLIAQRETFEKHTTFHRVDAFLQELLVLFAK